MQMGASLAWKEQEGSGMLNTLWNEAFLLVLNYLERTGLTADTCTVITTLTKLHYDHYILYEWVGSLHMYIVNAQAHPPGPSNPQLLVVCEKLHTYLVHLHNIAIQNPSPNAIQYPTTNRIQNPSPNTSIGIISRIIRHQFIFSG